MPALLPDDFSAGLEQVPDRAFSNWVAGDRASDECEQLRALAETIPVDELGRLHSALSQLAEAGEVTWRELDAAGVHKDSFLALLVALMASSDSDCAGTASAAYMAAARCSGAAAHGILHPMAAFELSKALRAVLCPAAPSSRAANPKAAPGRKRTKPDASDDWDDDRPHADTVWAAEAASDTRALVTSELSLLLQSVPLRAHADVLASFVSALVAVATTDLATPKASSRAQSRAAVHSAAPPHFDALALCLRIEHGDVAQTAPLIFRALVPHMALDAAPASSTVPKELLAAQAACIDFVLLVAAHHPSAAAGGGAASAEETRSLLHSVQALLQRVSVAAPERAEARAQVCAALSRLVLSLPAPVAARFAQFLWRYGHTAKIGARTFAIEMSAAVLQLAASSAEAQAVLLAAEDAPQTCWRLVLQRVSDKAAGARTKALGCLAALLEALHAPAAAAVLHMVQQPLLLSAVSPLSGATPHQPTPQDGTDRRLSLLSLTEPTPGPASRKLPGSCSSPATPADGGASPSASLVSAAKLEASLNGLGARLQQRCADERPAVRRVALLALEAWGVSTGIGLSRSQMAAIADRCQDSSPSIRKQAARSLTALLRLDPSSAATRAAWIDGVLPLARDSEATVSDAAVEALEEMLVEPLSECATAPHQPPADSLWMLLAAIRPPSLPHVQHAIGALAARSRLPAKLAPAVQAVLAQEAAARGDGKAARAALWAILLQVAQPPPKAGGKELVEPVRLLDSWRAAARRGASHAADATGALRVVLCLARRGGLSAKAAAGLRQELLDQMKAMDGAPETVATIAQTCCALGVLGTNDGWSQPLRAACAGTICAAGRRPSLATGTRDVQLALVIYGEVTLALSLAAAAVSPAAPEVVAAATDLAHGECEPALSATAFVALGKFCLGSASLANKLLPMFMRELGTNGQPAVRNNALIVLFDLVKRHTALFDRHLPTIALAVADTSPLVRHHAVVLLAQLLLEDYIKWRPSLLRAFCVALVDPEPSLRVVAKSCLFDMLLPRAPLLAFNSFLPLLFQLNGCLEHPQHSAPLPAEEKAAFELSGPDRQQSRLQILRGLLASMSDEHRLQVTAKLCHEVLAAVLDGQMTLAAAEAVLADSLRLLACREAKISGGAVHAEDGEDAAPSATSAAAAAKGKVLSLVARKATVEAIVPIVIELKRHLEKFRSPLLRDVFLFLRELLRDHKAHLQDILSRDKQLAAEVEYDMRQLASEQASARALQSITPGTNRRTPASAGSRPRAHLPGRTGGGGNSAPGASSLTVPTPDRLRSAMAIPKLRSQRSSLGSAGGGKSAGASRLSGGGENRMGPPQIVHRAKSADDVVMASPFKEQPPLRQWNVCPSPLAQSVFDAVA